MGEKSGLGGADPQDGESVRKRVRRVPDHQDRAVAEGAQDGLEETRFVVGVEARRGFVEEQDARRGGVRVRVRGGGVRRRRNCGRIR